MDETHYVQVRYARATRWTTVGASSTRDGAAALAAEIYRDALDARGATPTQVRVIDRERLLADAGEAAVEQAQRDLRDGPGEG